MTYSNEDISHLYLSIGEAIWHLQHLEMLMTTFNTLKILQSKRKNKISITDEQAYDVREKQRKLTLGTLISSAKENHILSKELEIRFERFLIERNWLIHKCVISDYLSLRNNETKEALFSRIMFFIEEALSLKEELYKKMEQWFIENNYSIEQAYNLSNEILRNYK